MLHELERYAGLVQINGMGGGTITGRLAFDRQTDNLQFTLQEPEFVSLFRDGSGEVKAFSGGEWLPQMPNLTIAGARAATTAPSIELRVARWMEPGSLNWSRLPQGR